MALENAQFIKDLNPQNPQPGDEKAEGDDHLRMIKRILKAQFPALDKAVTATPDKLNADYYPKNSGYYQARADIPMFEWHRPGINAYAAYVDPTSKRWSLATSAGSANAIRLLMTAGDDGVVEVYSNHIVRGESSASSMAIRGAGGLTMRWEQAGWYPRYIHRANELIGFLNSGGDWAFWSHNNGDLWARGNITAFSDDRQKHDWVKLRKDILHSIGGIKAGTYTRLDNGERHVGVSAQELMKVMPEAVIDQDGMLGVAYGNAALAICVELARAVTNLQYKVTALEAKK